MLLQTTILTFKQFNIRRRKLERDFFIKNMFIFVDSTQLIIQA